MTTLRLIGGPVRRAVLSFAAGLRSSPSGVPAASPAPTTRQSGPGNPLFPARPAATQPTTPTSAAGPALPARPESPRAGLAHPPRPAGVPNDCGFATYMRRCDRTEARR